MAGTKTGHLRSVVARQLGREAANDQPCDSPVVSAEKFQPLHRKSLYSKWLIDVSRVRCKWLVERKEERGKGKRDRWEEMENFGKTP
jgi:hypothetical protein